MPPPIKLANPPPEMPSIAAGITLSATTGCKRFDATAAASLADDGFASIPANGPDRLYFSSRPSADAGGLVVERRL